MPAPRPWSRRAMTRGRHPHPQPLNLRPTPSSRAGPVGRAPGPAPAPWARAPKVPGEHEPPSAPCLLDVEDDDGRAQDVAGILEGGRDARRHGPRLAVAHRLEAPAGLEHVVKVVQRLVVAQPDVRGLPPQVRLRVPRASVVEIASRFGAAQSACPMSTPRGAARRRLSRPAASCFVDPDASLTAAVDERGRPGRIEVGGGQHALAGLPLADAVDHQRDVP